MTGEVLPDFHIEELIKKEFIVDADPKLINPGSLDLRLGVNKFKLFGSFLPLGGQTISDSLSSRGIVDADNTKVDPFYLDLNQPYIIELVERLKLPPGISARIFNKSGCGRVGASVRGLTDGTSQFDLVPLGYSGKLYSEICATAFQHVIMPNETSMPQIRFYNGNPSPLSGDALKVLLKQHPILIRDDGEPSYGKKELEEIILGGQMTFTVDLSGEILGYKSKRNNRTFNFSKRNEYDPLDFFEEVHVRKGEKAITIQPGDFFILKSGQNIRLPPDFAAEISPYSPTLGDIRASYADLINPGHGYNPDNPDEKGNIFWEVRARDIPVVIQHGQPIARFNVYMMLESPRTKYTDKKTTKFDSLPSFLPKQFKKD